MCVCVCVLTSLRIVVLVQAFFFMANCGQISTFVGSYKVNNEALEFHFTIPLPKNTLVLIAHGDDSGEA